MLDLSAKSTRTVSRVSLLDEPGTRPFASLNLVCDAAKLDSSPILPLSGAIRKKLDWIVPLLGSSQRSTWSARCVPAGFCRRMPPWTPSCGVQVWPALAESATDARKKARTRRLMGSEASVSVGLPFWGPASIFPIVKQFTIGNIDAGPQNGSPTETLASEPMRRLVYI